MPALRSFMPLRSCSPLLARLLLTLLAALACGPTAAATGSESEAGLRKERGRLGAERLRLELEFVDEQRRCGERFVVTACLDDVRRRQRMALAPLRERELQIDADERRQRAVERLAAVAAKQQAALQRPPASETEQRVYKRLDPPVAAASRATRAVGSAAGRKAEIEAEAAARLSADAQRRAASELTRERIAARLADRVAKGKPSVPLPVPRESSPPRAPLAASAPRR